jgi:hypothetical protein
MALRSGHFLVHGLKLPIMQVDFAGVARLAPPSNRRCMALAGWPIWKRRVRSTAPGRSIAMAAIRSLRWPSGF